ncbi:MAG TPA: MFS transporter, partial [Acidimicrobiia bacterium]|nr:MFS transporter [Acidimicrobiia bacterium]
MYSSVRDRPAPAAGSPEGPDGPGAPGSGDGAPTEGIHRNVKLLGINSLLTDVSSESVNSVLPIYLRSVMGMSPQAYGIFEG